MEEISIVDSFDILQFQISNATLSMLKKRHMFYMWKRYYTFKYELFSEYYIEFHRFLVDFDDQNVFIEQNIKKTYEILLEKKKSSDINEYVHIMSGYSDHIILIYLENIDKVQRCSCFGFVIYKNVNRKID